MLVVEFSLSQKAFHKQNLEDMVKSNLENLLRRKQNDYQAIGLFNSHDEADSFISNNYDRFKDYGMFTTTEGETMIVE